MGSLWLQQSTSLYKPQNQVVWPQNWPRGGAFMKAGNKSEAYTMERNQRPLFKYSLDLAQTKTLAHNSSWGKQHACQRLSHMTRIGPALVLTTNSFTSIKAGNRDTVWLYGLAVSVKEAKSEALVALFPWDHFQTAIKLLWRTKALPCIFVVKLSLWMRPDKAFKWGKYFKTSDIKS